MVRTDPMAAEFEASGEAEVRRRVMHSDYDAPHLAHALRWLDDRAAERAHPHQPPDAEGDRRPGDRTLDTVMRFALGGAGVAAAAGVVVGVLSHR